ncbi:MAG: tRNA 2-thiouridine(34) synthase MnmA [Nakamurella sp.]
MKIIAAMSGGVDSALAAALAVEAGHDVTGVHMALSRSPKTLRTGSRGCCSVEDAFDARRVCDVIGIPFYIWDFSEEFQKTVVKDFLAEYKAGRTPNPCLTCNQKIKFAALMDRALALGFDGVATGHYAQVDGEKLTRSADMAKDQSYVLSVLTPHQVKHSIFPLGGMTKVVVRVEAAKRGFAVADKPDSYDLCFIPDGDTRGYLSEKLGKASGDVVDQDTGETVATHGGYFGYTVGQRKGLNIRQAASDGHARYVLGVEPETGTVKVGRASHLDVFGIVADQVVYPSGPLDLPVHGKIQVRAHGRPVPGMVEMDDDGALHIELDEPIRGVAAGQTAAVYDDTNTVVLAAGKIATTRRRDE